MASGAWLVSRFGRIELLSSRSFSQSPSKVNIPLYPESVTCPRQATNEIGFSARSSRWWKAVSQWWRRPGTGDSHGASPYSETLKKEQSARLFHFFFIPCPPVMSGRPSSQPLRAAGGRGTASGGVSLGVPRCPCGHRGTPDLSATSGFVASGAPSLVCPQIIEGQPPERVSLVGAGDTLAVIRLMAPVVPVGTGGWLSQSGSPNPPTHSAAVSSSTFSFSVVPSTGVSRLSRILMALLMNTPSGRPAEPGPQRV